MVENTLSGGILYFSDNVTLAYPFFYRPMFEIIEDGWQAFQAESEFSRVSHVSGEWRLSNVNKNFEVSHFNISILFLLTKTTDERLFTTSFFYFTWIFANIGFDGFQ